MAQIVNFAADESLAPLPWSDCLGCLPSLPGFLGAADGSQPGPASAKPYRLALISRDTMPPRNFMRGGLDIELDKGWKTYWRMPGDAGIPPQFDWSRSRNVKSVEVLWPAPQRFHDQGGETIGYKDRVVFPLAHRSGKSAMQPVELDLSLFFGVCEDICIPGKAELTAKTGRADPAGGRIDCGFRGESAAKGRCAVAFPRDDGEACDRRASPHLALRLARSKAMRPRISTSSSRVPTSPISGRRARPTTNGGWFHCHSTG